MHFLINVCSTQRNLANKNIKKSNQKCWQQFQRVKITWHNAPGIQIKEWHIIF